jgi:hypothetical protein
VATVRPASLALCLTIYFSENWPRFQQAKNSGLSPELFRESGKKLVELGGSVIQVKK